MTPRLIFDLPLSQAEGFLRSILFLIDVDLESPDHTTLSQRSQRAAAKHGGRGKRAGKKSISAPIDLD